MKNSINILKRTDNKLLLSTNEYSRGEQDLKWEYLDSYYYIVDKNGNFEIFHEDKYKHIDHYYNFGEQFNYYYDGNYSNDLHKWIDIYGIYDAKNNLILKDEIFKDFKNFKKFDITTENNHLFALEKQFTINDEEVGTISDITNKIIEYDENLKKAKKIEFPLSDNKFIYSLKKIDDEYNVIILENGKDKKYIEEDLGIPYIKSAEIITYKYSEKKNNNVKNPDTGYKSYLILIIIFLTLSLVTLKYKKKYL